MTRVVQLELTLNVEVTAHFEEPDDTNLGGWTIDDIASVKIAGGDVSKETITDILFNEYAQSLSELYTQQEP
jgi:hypothetical protein